MNKAILERAREVFDIEIEGLNALRNQLDDNFVKLVELCSKTIDAGGKLIITGVGKSGHIGRKIAATLSSVGTPSVFMHPVEARHGDLGLIQENDLMLGEKLARDTESKEMLELIFDGITYDPAITYLGFSSHYGDGKEIKEAVDGR